MKLQEARKIVGHLTNSTIRWRYDIYKKYAIILTHKENREFQALKAIIKEEGII